MGPTYGAAVWDMHSSLGGGTCAMQGTWACSGILSSSGTPRALLLASCWCLRPRQLWLWWGRGWEEEPRQEVVQGEGSVHGPCRVETPLALTEKPLGRIPDRDDSFPAGSDDFASPVNLLQPSRLQGQHCPSALTIASTRSGVPGLPSGPWAALGARCWVLGCWGGGCWGADC